MAADAFYLAQQGALSPHVRALMDAAASKKDIVLKLSMGLDGGRKPKGVESDAGHKVVTLESVNEYIDIRRALRKHNDARLNGRLYVSYGDQVIPHAQFALENDAEKITDLYQTMKAQALSSPLPDAQKPASSFPRFFIFHRTHTDANIVPHKKYMHRVRGYVGPLESHPFAEAILLEHLSLRGGDVPAMRRQALSRDGLYVIARPHISIQDARSVQMQFEQAATHEKKIGHLWPYLVLPVYGDKQMTARPNSFDNIALPAPQTETQLILFHS